MTETLTELLAWAVVLTLALAVGEMAGRGLHWAEAHYRAHRCRRRWLGRGGHAAWATAYAERQGELQAWLAMQQRANAAAVGNWDAARGGYPSSGRAADELTPPPAGAAPGGAAARGRGGEIAEDPNGLSDVGSSRVDLQACKLEYSIVSPK